MSKPKVLVIGDAILDVVSEVETGRLSAEAPTPVFAQVGKDKYRPGGAGNVAANAAAMGADVVLVCPLHQTWDASQKFAESVRRRDVRLARYPTQTFKRDIPVKRRSFCGSRLVHREDREGSATLPPLSHHDIDALYGTMGDIPVVVFSDYGCGAFNHAPIQHLMDEFSARGSKVLVDPKPRASGPTYQGSYALKPNDSELWQLSGYMGIEDDDLDALAKKVRQRGGHQNVVTTLGAEGVLWVDQDDNVHRYPTRASRVFDVCGAGDSFMAAMALELSIHGELGVAIRRAQLAASVAISYPGTVSVSALEYRLAKAEHEESRFKIVDAGFAVDAAYSWRCKEETVVFTNGCFDVLHPGHLYLLERARQLGTRLIVGLNTDASARRLKGPDRPKCCQAWRAELLAALSCVDLVVLFDEDTPTELVKRLKPNILVKDETVGDLPEGQYADRVELIPRLPEHSTTAFLAKVPQ